MKRKLKTITLFYDRDNPGWSICPGHVTATAYNKAFKAEGWSSCDWIAKSQLRHEHWKKLKSGAWKQCKETDKGARAVTVSDW